MANQYAQILGQIFTHEMKPMEVEILVAEVGYGADDYQLFHILYDGTVMDERRFSVLGGGPTPSASTIHPKPTSYDIREDFDLVHVADFAGMSCGAFAARSDSNGFVHYAYVSHGNLYYGVEGVAGNPAIVSAGTVSCDPIDLALKPNGSAVIGWIDIRNAYSAPDGSAAGYDLFVASEDSGWSETLVTASTDQRVLTFQMDLDSLGTIHVAYDRMTVAAWPYDPVLYYAKSPAWQEVAVSSTGVWTRPSLAVDSGNHAHVAWSYTGNIENVWYATDVNGWTNLQVDQNQSSNYWDEAEWAPSIKPVKRNWIVSSEPLPNTI